jgi:hypothetical protein
MIMFVGNPLRLALLIILGLHFPHSLIPLIFLLPFRKYNGPMINKHLLLISFQAIILLILISISNRIVLLIQLLCYKFLILISHINIIVDVLILLVGVLEVEAFLDDGIVLVEEVMAGILD